MVVQLETGAIYVRPCQRRRGVDDLLIFGLETCEAEEPNITGACNKRLVKTLDPGRLLKVGS